jgi:3-dehydroquinate dehydratase-2
MKRKMKMLVINGPNLNMLGIREPEIYGAVSYKGLCQQVEEHAENIDVSVEIYQSNHEGDLIDKIQMAYDNVDGIVINPGGYTHTSVAILDAIKAVAKERGIPKNEVYAESLKMKSE